MINVKSKDLLVAQTNEFFSEKLGDTLSVSQVANLSGFSRSYVYKLLDTEVLPFEVINGQNLIATKQFIKWFSHLDFIPESPFGYASYSLKGMKKYTNRERIWLLLFVKRNNIHSYFIGKVRRFHAKEVAKYWNLEEYKFCDWITIEDAMRGYQLTSSEIRNAIVKHFVGVKNHQSTILLNHKDIKHVFRGGNNHAK